MDYFFCTCSKGGQFRLRMINSELITCECCSCGALYHVGGLGPSLQRVEGS